MTAVAPLRIAQFTSSLIGPLGGAEQYCLALARHQHADGHDVTVVTGWVDDPIRAALEAEGIRVMLAPTARPYTPDGKGGSLPEKLRFHGLELLDSLRRTAATRMLESERFDVVHVHRFSGFGTAVLRPRGTRVIHTAHDYSLVHSSASLVVDGVLLEAPGLLQRLRSRLITRGLRGLTIVFPARPTRDRHMAWGLSVLIDETVVPHGWPRPAGPSTGSPVARPGTAGADPVTFLFLGKLSEHKGVPLLLDAWGPGVDGARLRIGGDGGLAAHVADAPVEALGWLDESQRTVALRSADALVMPSVWPENFPIVVAEALLAGIPVITTTVAAPPLVDEGESGLLVAADAVSLRAALERFTADPALRQRLKDGAIERAATLDMDHHGSAVMSIYARGTDAPQALKVDA